MFTVGMCFYFHIVPFNKYLMSISLVWGFLLGDGDTQKVSDAVFSLGSSIGWMK